MRRHANTAGKPQSVPKVKSRKSCFNSIVKWIFGRVVDHWPCRCFDAATSETDSSRCLDPSIPITVGHAVIYFHSLAADRAPTCSWRYCQQPALSAALVDRDRAQRW